MILRRYAKAWFISLTAMVLVGCTVHFWNVLACFFFFLSLAGWIADPAPMRRPVAAGDPAVTTNGRRRRRSRRRPFDVPGALQPA
jgi:hypothetical protein